MGKFEEMEDFRRHGTFGRVVESIAVEKGAQQESDRSRERRDVYGQMRRSERPSREWDNEYGSLVKGVLDDQVPCVYWLRTEGGLPYIGQSVNLECRIVEHLLSLDSSAVTGADPAALVERVWSVLPCGMTDMQSQDVTSRAVESCIFGLDMKERQGLYDNPETLGKLLVDKGVLSSPDFVSYEPGYVQALNEAYFNDEWIDDNLEPSRPAPNESYGAMLKKLRREAGIELDGRIESALYSTRRAFIREGKEDEAVCFLLGRVLAYCNCGDYTYANHILHGDLFEQLYESHKNRCIARGECFERIEDFPEKTRRHN